MHEEFIYYIWQYQLFNQSQLSTTSDKEVKLIHTGERNNSSGPDFTNVRLRMDGLEWAGNVEIHVKTSDWIKHKHHQDPAFKTALLHVVWEHDQLILPDDIPVLELKGRVSKSIIDKFKLFTEQNQSDILCKSQHEDLSEFLLFQWLERMLIERMESRFDQIQIWLNQTKNDWDEVAFRSLLQAFGSRINKQPFDQLDNLLPFKLLVKSGKYKEIKALLFGVSGLLDRYKEDDKQQLVQEFDFLKKKFNLQSLPAESWKFGRVRPANSPLVRMEQLSQLIGQNRLMQNWIECVKSSHFDTLPFAISSRETQVLTTSFRELIFINAVFPTVFAYAHFQELDDLKELVLEKFQKLSPEKNTIIKQWKSLPLKSWSAGYTQALLHLTQNYCKQKKCLSCSIGNSILRTAL